MSLTKKEVIYDMVTSLHRCGFWKAVHKHKALVPDEYKTFIDTVCISNNDERRVQ